GGPLDGRLDASIDAPIDGAIDTIDAPPVLAFCNAADPTLRGCYRFENNLDDGSMYSNGGTGTASYTNVNGNIGRALDASGSSVTIPFDSSLSTAQFTLKMWIRPSSVPSGASSRMGLIDNNKWRMFVQMGGRIRCAINDGTVEVVSSATVPVNTWTRVTCSYGAGALKVFFDGVQRGSTSSGNGLDGLSTGTTIGRQEPSGDPFDGLIDDVQIFSAVVAP
ncbi:MAG: LamG domain-containing protein, partial [Deltaproteobacteria bacterium]|nr:LamG domain-containing protein [Deltaproteobacteria bacterium]